jgi:alpha-amylase
MLFYGHYFGTVPIALSSVPGEQAALSKLVLLRKEQGITAASTCRILRAESGLYAALIDGKLALALGPHPWTPEVEGLPGPWSLAASGKHYAVWTRAPMPAP